MKAPPKIWFDSREKRLELLWAEGRSISQIAADLGHGITRSAVIGKVHRMGLPPRGKRCSDPVVLEERKKKATAAQVKAHRISRGTVAPLVERGPREPHPDAPARPEPRNLTFAEIGKLECRWIENEDMREPLFCGHAVTGEGSSWCPYHKHVLHHGSYRISEEERERRREHGRSIGKTRNTFGIKMKDAIKINVLDEEAA